MNISKTKDILDRTYDRENPEAKDLVYLISLENKDDLTYLFSLADKVRQEYMGQGILLRGIVEFSNYCRNSCYYCGLNKNNARLARYKLTIQEIIESVDHIIKRNIKTVVLQSGECGELDYLWLAEVIKEIRLKFDIAITLSVGEWKEKEYKSWRDAGADRYLLKIETTDKKLYQSLHPQMNFDNRMRCLEILRNLSYQVGTGNIIGLKNQTLEQIVGDILFFKSGNFDMVGIGPFIPHPETKLNFEPKGNVSLTLKTVALARIVTKNAHIPATTALGSVGEEDYRINALKAGANVLMPNFTPLKYKKLYEIYPNKRCVDEAVGACSFCAETIASSINRFIDYSKGNSLKGAM
ncbi:MAG: [FeFe] hydrogenase H-cluster radical SAM maturase HydE [Candidatus Omnitrophota bacterium]